MSNPVPTITFQIDLTPHSNEVVGPIENARSVGMAPTQSGANAAAQQANIVNLIGGIVPALAGGIYKNLKHGDTFVEYGQKAIYLRNMYGQGYAPADRAYLKIVSVA